ncbi:MAG: GntR family transcriptional regulator [Arcanobacterium sp.]|nr:GntR family transcriptional regulator [Arcanobacterium sp.]
MKPKYHAVYDELISRIERLEPGAKLDSELEIARQLAVSPMTVRRALERLAQQGKTVGVPGRGTFVSAQRDKTSKDDAVLALEKLHSFHLDSASIDHADHAEAAALSIAEHDLLYRIVQTRHDDGAIVGHDYALVPCAAFPDLLSEDLERPVRQCLNGAFHTTLYCAHLRIRATDGTVTQDASKAEIAQAESTQTPITQGEIPEVPVPAPTLPEAAISGNPIAQAKASEANATAEAAEIITPAHIGITIDQHFVDEHDHTRLLVRSVLASELNF